MEITMRKWKGFILMLLVRTCIPVFGAVYLMMSDGTFRDGIFAGLFIASAIHELIRTWRGFR